MISGGTSVNTIAQQAEMLYEFRSDNREDLEFMDRHFHSVIESYRAKMIEVNTTLMGEVPARKKCTLIGFDKQLHQGAFPYFTCDFFDQNTYTKSFYSCHNRLH